MATLQKFKLFATQCAAVNIPTQSPTTSPLLLRRRSRRKTLRMLLTRRPHISDPDPQPLQPPPSSSINRRLKLRELFFSSSTSSTHALTHARVDKEEEEGESGYEIGSVRSDCEGVIGPKKVVRSVYQPFRCRNRILLRKAWRPVLSTIDEIQV